MRSRGTDSADKISVSALDVAIPSPSSARAAASPYGPQHAPQIVHARLPHCKPNLSTAGLPEGRKPALTRHEAADVPPAAEQPEEGIERPRRAARVGMRPAFAEDERAAVAQHVSQMVQCGRLVLGAMQGIDREDRIEIPPLAGLVEIVAL